MTQGINGSTGPSQVVGPTLGPSSSIQLLFAKIQLEMAQTAKTQAKDRLDSIQASQDEQKQVAAMLNQARQLQSNAKSEKGDCPWDKKASMMPEEMQKYMDDHDLAYNTKGDDLANNEEEWKEAITSLEGRLEMLGTDTQQQMVYVQDYMGQYNSYLQGANTQIAEANRTTSALAKGQ